MAVCLVRCYITVTTEDNTVFENQFSEVDKIIPLYDMFAYIIYQTTSIKRNQNAHFGLLKNYRQKSCSHQNISRNK